MLVSGFHDVETAACDLLEDATDELVHVDLHPFVRPVSAGALPSAMFGLLDRGVRLRTVFCGALSPDPRYGTVRADLHRTGAEARELDRAQPMGFMVADRRTALLPVQHDGPWVRTALVLRGDVLAGFLRHAFDQMWDLADAQVPRLDRAETGLLQLLDLGMTDAAIGRHLAVSGRTVGRRLARLQRTLGARTRFQLGVEAARRGAV